MKISVRKISVGLALLSTMATSSFAELFPSSGPTVGGSRAMLRGTLAIAPSDAPLAVKRAIWAANELRSKPYRYGGGHKSFSDSGYDCSGTVSFALAAAGLMKVPLSSGEFRHYGSDGLGKWITVYARHGHTFAVIAGLRLDTTAWHSKRDNFAPRWQPNPRKPAGFVARHPEGL